FQQRKTVVYAAANVESLAESGTVIRQAGNLAVAIEQIGYVQQIANLLAVAADFEATTLDPHLDEIGDPPLIFGGVLVIAIDAGLAERDGLQAINGAVIANVLFRRASGKG